MGVETIEEQLSAWEDGKSFSYVYHDAPWPIESVSNQWTLEADGDETRLTLTPSLKMRGGAWTQWLAPAMLWLMSRSLKDDVPQMVAAIERECAEFSQSSRGRPDRA